MSEMEDNSNRHGNIIASPPDELSSYRRMSSASSDESGFNSDMSDEAHSQPVPCAAGNHATRNGCCTDLLSKCQSREEVKIVARHLVTDIVVWMTWPEARTLQPSCCSHTATLRRVVDGLSSRHEIIFESIIRKLPLIVNGSHLQSDVCYRTFSGVVDELFADGQYNWGRIVTVFAFTGWLARSGARQGGFDAGTWSETVSSVAGSYIAEKLSAWICQQGGWDAMDKFFAEPEALESKVWRGLLYTFVGLGVLASVAAAVR
jgi:hypothetical protein